MSNSPIVSDVLDNGLRILTERMTQVRSISIGVWLTRGSRHEAAERGGIAHFVEHMLFKGTATRSAEDIAQAIDSIGGQLDAFTAKEYASYYIKVLDEHLPLALDILSDIVLNPAFSPDDIEREKKVVVEEIKMVEDTPDDLVHELFTQGFWENHPLGRPILGTRETVESFNADLLRDYFVNAYTPRNLIVSAVGNLEHERVRELVEEKFGVAEVGRRDGRRAGADGGAEDPDPQQGAGAEPSVPGRQQLPAEPRRSLFELRAEHAARRIDELAAVSERAREAGAGLRGVQRAQRVSGRRARSPIYAGCANEAVGEVIDLVVEELRGVKQAPVPEPSCSAPRTISRAA